MSPPIISNCPQPVAYSLSPGASSRIVTWTEPTAVDNSGGIPTVMRSHMPGETFLVGSTEVTYVFTDQAGNSATCAFLVTVGKNHAFHT